MREGEGWLLRHNLVPCERGRRLEHPRAPWPKGSRPPVPGQSPAGAAAPRPRAEPPRGGNQRCAPAELRRPPRGLPAPAARLFPSASGKASRNSELCREMGAGEGVGEGGRGRSAAAASGRPPGRGGARPAAAPAPAPRGGGNRVPHRGFAGMKGSGLGAASTSPVSPRIAMKRAPASSRGREGNGTDTPAPPPPRASGPPKRAGSGGHLCPAGRRGPRGAGRLPGRVTYSLSVLRGMFLGTPRSASPWQSTVLPEQEHCAGQGCGATSPAIASSSPRDRVSFPQPHIITARCRPAGARRPRPRGGRRGARRPPPRRGERSGNFRGAEISEVLPSQSSAEQTTPAKWGGWHRSAAEGNFAGKGGAGPGPSLASPSGGGERRHSGLVFTRSLRRRSKPTGWGYGGVGLAPDLPPPRPSLTSRDSPARGRRAPSAPAARFLRGGPRSAAAAPTRVPRRGPLTAPRGAAAGLTPRTHRPARGASANHTPLAGIHQTVSRKEEGGERRRKKNKKRSQTQKMMLGLAFHPPRPLLLYAPKPSLAGKGWS